MINILLCVLAFLFPPLPVAMLKGFGEQFVISVVLTILAYVPGLVHAVWVVLTHEGD